MRRFLLAACLTLPALAGDLDGFLKSLNIQARSDLNGFSARVAAQFQIGDLQVQAVLNKVDDPADAFMIFQLGHMTRQPVERVYEVYKSHKGKGWGNVAKQLGIKPGSAEFHALKRGDFQLRGGRGEDADTPKGNKHGKGRGKGHDKH